jgi:hypothetical protein
MAEVVNICYEAIPCGEIIGLIRAVRHYQSQVVGPLVSCASVATLRNAAVLDAIGSGLFVINRYQDSERLLLKAIRHYSEVLGPEHKDTLGARSFLLQLYGLSKRVTDAETVGDDILKTCIRALGDRYPITLAIMLQLARIRMCCDNLDEGAAMAEQLSTLHLGEDHPEIIDALKEIFPAYCRQGKWEEAASIEDRLWMILTSTEEIDADKFDDMQLIAPAYPDDPNGLLKAVKWNEKNWLVSVIAGAERLPCPGDKHSSSRSICSM